VTAVFTTNQVDAAVEMCVAGTGLGMFLSYQVVSEITAKALRPVLEAFEPEPLPVHVVFPQARLQSPRTRAFLDVCVSALRAARLG